MRSILVPGEFQGPTGRGQGGWTAFRFAEAIGDPVTVALQAPIPLETELSIERSNSAGSWRLFNPADPEVAIMTATAWVPDYPAVPFTDPVGLTEATRAQAGFPLTPEEHHAPHCMSCGYVPGSLGVRSGPLGDGRWANVWRPTGWAVRPDGSVDAAGLWTSLDCASGWYVCCEGPSTRAAVTVQLVVDIFEPLRAEVDYVMVCGPGDYPPHWDGRKRGAMAALFDPDGTCAAQSRSFWLSIDP